MTLLVTRPLPDALATQHHLKTLGLPAMVMPLLTVEALEAPVPSLAGCQGVLIGSMHGLRRLAALTPARNTPVYTVGLRSAEEARHLGFTDVYAADGDVQALQRLVAQRCDPTAGHLVYPHGEVWAGHLAEGLRGQGFTVAESVLYRTVPREDWDHEVLNAWMSGAITGVLLYSARTALALHRLLTPDMPPVACFCLSAAVAEAVPCAPTHVAPQPQEQALLALVAKELAPRRSLL